LQLVKSTIDIDCLQVSLKFWMKRAFSSAQDPMEFGGSPFNQVRAVPSNIMVKYLAIATSLTSSSSMAIS
ncbi:hypothetical protein T12_10567, partial [Trichinella patagoniensis]